MSMHKTRTDITDFDLALIAVDDLLDKYEPKHQGAWRTQSAAEHFAHARDHARSSVSYVTDTAVDVCEEDLVSCATRALMGLQVWLLMKEAARVGQADLD